MGLVLFALAQVLRQLDANLNRWRGADLPARPSSGWIKAVREGLGMTATHLAARLGVATSGESIEAQTRALAENLLKGSRRALWKEPVREKSAS